MHWFSKEFMSEEVKSAMPYRRFRQISKQICLYSEDEAKLTGESDPASPNYDPLFKITPCWKAFLLAAQENKNPSEEMAIDECIIALKARKNLSECSKK